MRLKNKVALVVGGTGDIGRAIVLELAKEGAVIAFTYQSNKGAADKLLKGTRSKGLAFQAEARDLKRAQEIVKEVRDKLGHIDILVNSIGTTQDKTLLFMSEKDWLDVIETNLTSVFTYTKAVIASLMKQKSGTVINLASVSGMIGLPGQSNYGASKAGVIGFTRSLAKEVGKTGVTVNAVAPGFVESRMFEKIPERFREQIMNNIPLGRIGKAEEVAKLVAYLASDEARYITGQVIVIDGGLTS